MGLMGRGFMREGLMGTGVMGKGLLTGGGGGSERFGEVRRGKEVP